MQHSTKLDTVYDIWICQNSDLTSDTAMLHICIVSAGYLLDTIAVVYSAKFRGWTGDFTAETDFEAL